MPESFLSLASYTGGRTLPKGLYAVEFQVKLHAGTKADGSRGVERLGVMGNFHPITEEGEHAGEPIENFFSMGSKAHLNFMPNDEGTGLERIPDTTQGLTNKSNWFYFFKSLVDCGMPDGTGDGDITALNGIWIRTDNVPAPEDRKGFASNTGEAADEERKGPDTIAIAIEILDNGKPWEGGGGIPEAGEKKKKPAAKPTAAKPAAATKPAAVKKGGVDAREVVNEALQSVLPANPAGGSKLKIRTAVFKLINDKQGADVAKAAVEGGFDKVDVLQSLLADNGWELSGSTIKPQE